MSQLTQNEKERVLNLLERTLSLEAQMRTKNEKERVLNLLERTLRADVERKRIGDFVAMCLKKRIPVKKALKEPLKSFLLKNWAMEGSI